MRALQATVLAAIASACTNLDLEFPHASASNSRFAILARESPACGIAGRAPKQGRLPPLLAERTGEQILLEIPVGDEYDADAELTLAKIDVDPALIQGLLLPMPQPLHAWSLSEGQLTPLDLSTLTDLLNGLSLVSPRSCPQAVEQACALTAPRCLEPESITDYVLEDAGGYRPSVASAGDRVFAVSGKVAYAIDASGATKLDTSERFIAVAEDGNRGAYFFSERGCLFRANEHLVLRELACLPQSPTFLTGAMEARSANAVSILTPNGLYEFDGAQWSMTMLPTEPTGNLSIALLPAGESILALESTVYWQSHDNFREFTVGIGPLLAKNPQKQIFIVEIGFTATVIYRFDLEESRRRNEVTLVLDQKSESFGPSLFFADDVFPWMGLRTGELIRAGSKCPSSQIGRVAVAMARYNDGFVVIGNNVLKFNYIEEADTRAYVITMKPPEYNCGAN